jgi:hypothetical protein
MTTVLALIGSARNWGNGEVLAREAFIGAQEAGADRLNLLRLTDLRLEPCTGCLICAIGGKPCPLDDDLRFLLRQVADADAIIVTAPTYFLGPSAQVKRILDRLLIWTSLKDWAESPPKPAVVMSTASLPSWRGTAAPFNNALALGLGCQLLGSMTAYAPGPGEVLLQPDVLARARDLGRRLLTGEPVPQPEGACPACGADFFRIEGNSVICPVCGQTGELRITGAGTVIDFHPPDPSGRWTRPGLYEHVQDWIIPSGERFMARRFEVKAGRARYDGQPVEWIRPT